MTQKKLGTRVAVGLSGGVDSAVSAALLQAQGYEVTGVFLICYHGPGCRTDEDRKDALDVAIKLGIPFEVLDFREAYQEKVLGYFKDEYAAGRTPNPDVVCNREIKFGLFYEWVMKQGFACVATGHYARIRRIREFGNLDVKSTPTISPLLRGREREGFALCRGVDEHKDQTYFLYQLREEQLGHILFPVGGMTKVEVRAQAEELGLSVAGKKDSMGICFVGEVSVSEFLRSMGVTGKDGKVILRVTENSEYSVNQKIGQSDKSDNLKHRLTESSECSEYVIGKHEGVWNYTIGQRLRKLQDQDNKNLKLAGFDLTKLPPLYVIEKKVKENQLIVGTREQCYRDEFEVGEVHWISPDYGLRMSDDSRVQVRIRHGGKLINAKLQMLKAKRYMMRVVLEEPVFGAAAGQACVFYDGEVCLGGGVIG